MQLQRPHARPTLQQLLVSCGQDQAAGSQMLRACSSNSAMPAESRFVIGSSRIQQRSRRQDATDSDASFLSRRQRASRQVGALIDAQASERSAKLLLRTGRRGATLRTRFSSAVRSGLSALM